MFSKFRLSTYFVLVLFSAVIITGCKKKMEADKTVISVKGSDTMVNLAQRWAEEYMKSNQNISVQVTGGGSGTGIAALLNNTVDLANASRELKPDEIKKADSLKIVPNIVKVALDGISVIVNPASKIEELTLQQLSDIFTGKVTNWKQLGGADAKIVLYGRENSSGTYEFFKEHVMNKQDFAVNTQVLQGTAALGEAVAKDVNGIGYGGVGYFAKRNDVKIIKVKKDANSPAIAPALNGEVNYKAIWDGTYSISRYLYCFTNGEPKPAVKAFIDFILSKQGQDLVKQMEYIPLPEK
jgi:phosphate transport system substrate-binding protein